MKITTPCRFFLESTDIPSWFPTSSDSPSDEVKANVAQELCSIFCNKFNALFKSNCQVRELYSDSSSRTFGFPIFEFNGEISQYYYFCVILKGNNINITIGTYSFEYMQNMMVRTSLCDLKHLDLTQNASVHNLFNYEINITNVRSLFNSVVMFYPIFSYGYYIGGITDSRDDKDAAYDVLHNGIQSEGVFILRCKDLQNKIFSGGLTSGSAQYHSGSPYIDSTINFNVNFYGNDFIYCGYKENFAKQPITLNPYKMLMSHLDYGADEMIVSRIIHSEIIFETTYVSMFCKSIPGNIKNFYSALTSEKVNGPIVEIFNKNGINFYTTVTKNLLSVSTNWHLLYLFANK